MAGHTGQGSPTRSRPVETNGPMTGELPGWGPARLGDGTDGRMPVVKAIRYDLADPEFPASLVEIAEPGLPTGEWVRIAVSAGGISTWA